MSELDDLKHGLGDIPWSDKAGVLRTKSRDYYWYSPILKKELDGCRAEIVVTPRTEEDVIRVASLCAKLKIYLTTRGGGTGNYGQAMPMRGGVVMDMSDLNKVLSVEDGILTVEAGARMVAIDEEIAATGLELRLHPSTKAQASVGGFVGGGFGGVGSIGYGRLADLGNLISARIITLEETPQIIELQGARVQDVHQSWGTNGIITQLRMALAPSQDWRDMVATFDTFAEACAFGQALGEHPAIIKKLVTALASPIPQYLKPLGDLLPEGQAVILGIIAANGTGAFTELAAQHGGKVAYECDSRNTGDVGPIYEYAWNHTTMHAMRADKSFTYIQALYPFGQNLELLQKVDAHFDDEVMIHAEFIRLGGVVTNSSLPLVRYTTPERLQEIMDFHASLGISVANPHIHVLDNSYKRVSLQDQIALKGKADPHNLFNPGKITY